MKDKEMARMRAEFKEINKRLDEVIERAAGEEAEYEGTSFKKDMCKKFGIPIK